MAQRVHSRTRLAFWCAQPGAPGGVASVRRDLLLSRHQGILVVAALRRFGNLPFGDEARREEDKWSA
jgi:hypothetical protein